jgi:hypothetical protein
MALNGVFGNATKSKHRVGIAEIEESCLITYYPMEMNPKALLHRVSLCLLCASLFCSGASSQSWVGNDSFDGTVLNSSKWSTTEEQLIDGVANFSKLPGVVSYKNVSSSTALGFVRWKQALPLNESWTVYVRTIPNKRYFTGTSIDQLAEAVLIVYPSGGYISDKYFSVANGITYEFNNVLPYIGTDCKGTSASDGYNRVNIRNDGMFLKISYDSSSSTLKAYYTADTGSGTPGNGDTWIQPFKTAVITAWGASSLDVAIGGYSEGVAVAEGIINLDDFVIKPKPYLNLQYIGTPYYNGIETQASFSFQSHEYVPGYLEYRTDLSQGSWVIAGAAFPGKDGLFNITLKSLGNKTYDWGNRLFFQFKNP